MERISVQSSNLVSVGYESNIETLEVEFFNGSIYEYQNVPQSVFDGLMNASSLGSYLNSVIVNKYPCNKIG